MLNNSIFQEETHKKKNTRRSAEDEDVEMEDEYGEEAMYDGNTTVEETSTKKSAAQARAERYTSRKGEPIVELAPAVKKLKFKEATITKSPAVTKSVSIKTKAQEAAEETYEDPEEPKTTKRIKRNDGSAATVAPSATTTVPFQATEDELQQLRSLL